MPKASPSRLAKDRGYRWEKEVEKTYPDARRMNAGPGTDVEMGEFVIECKSQQDDDGLKKLVAWVEQARKYRDDENWMLCIKLGMGPKALKLEVRPFGASAQEG